LVWEIKKRKVFSATKNVGHLNEEISANLTSLRQNPQVNIDTVFHSAVPPFPSRLEIKIFAISFLEKLQLFKSASLNPTLFPYFSAGIKTHRLYLKNFLLEN